MSGSHYLEIPARAGSPSANSSSKLSLCIGNCPEKVIVLSSLEGELCDDAFISHAHKRYWNPWVAKGFQLVQLIQKHLRLTADQAHVLFIADSSFPAHPWPWLGKPWCRTPAPADQTFWCIQQGSEPVSLDWRWELGSARGPRLLLCLPELGLMQGVFSRWYKVWRL